MSRMRGLLCGVAFLAVSTAAQAAETTEPVEVETVVVTARRTEENLQSTPVAVTATSGETLEKAQVTRVDQLQNIAPGLVIQPAVAQPGSAAFSLRGQSSPDGLIAVDQSVGVYVDGVYVARSSGALFNFVDVQRVEVLRGPQGTLFGRNTTGGAVNLVTKLPTGEFEGSVRVRAGNFNAFEVTGVINVPIRGDEIALRGVFQHSEHDGYGYNAAFKQDVGSDETDFLRFSFLVAPENSPLKLLFQADYTDRRTGGELIGLKSYTPTGTNGFLVSTCSGPAANAACPYKGPAGDTLANYALDNGGTGGFYKVFNSNPGIYGDAKTGGASLTVDWELAENLSLKSITAFRKIETASLSDNDGTPYLFTGGKDKTQGNFIDQEQWSQELQLSGDAFDGRWTYIGGLFAFTEEGRDTSKSFSVFPLSGALGYNDAAVKNDSVAVYGQTTFKITDALRLTAGLRYTEDKRWMRRFNRSESPAGSGVFTCSMAASTLDPGKGCQATTSKDYNYVSYTVGLDWQATEDLFFYIKTSRANKSGGFNTRATVGGPAVGFDPEQVTDYEAGAKLDLFERRARLNIAAFHSDYTDVQRNVPVVVPGSVLLSSGIQNAAEAKIEGLEIELTVRPIAGLRLTAAATFLDPKYEKFTIPAAGGTTIDVSRTPFSYAPKRAYSYSGDYTVPVAGGDLNFHLDYAWRSDTWSVGPLVGTGLFGAANPDTNKIPSYGLLNGQVSWTTGDGRLEFAVYGRNLTDEEYFQRLLALQDTALGITSYLPGDPRTFGVSVNYRF